MKKTYRIALTSCLAAAGLMLAYIEAILPFPMPLPGMKLGLANLATVLALYLLGPLHGATVSLIRILLSSLLFGNPIAMLYSLAGGASAYLGMLLLHRLRFSPIGASAIGGVLHHVGQIVVATLVTKTPRLLYYLAPLTVAGVITGCLIGCAAKAMLTLVTKHVPKLIYRKKTK